jgi:hypothetical protein
MAKRERDKKLTPLVGTEVQLPLPLDWTSPAEEKKPIYSTTDPVAEVGHACPGCGRNLKRWKGWWACDGCGYSSCGEVE